MTVRVVAAAIVRDGLVLAAHRVRPEIGWELPGGKVEPGESDVVALVREIDEELGVPIDVGARLGSATDDRITLVLYAAAVSAGEPAVRDDHDELRWVSAAELAGMAWLPIDRQLLPLLAPP